MCGLEPTTSSYNPTCSSTYDDVGYCVSVGLNDFFRKDFDLYLDNKYGKVCFKADANVAGALLKDVDYRVSQISPKLMYELKKWSSTIVAFTLGDNSGPIRIEKDRLPAITRLFSSVVHLTLQNIDYDCIPILARGFQNLRQLHCCDMTIIYFDQIARQQPRLRQLFLTRCNVKGKYTFSDFCKFTKLQTLHIHQERAIEDDEIMELNNLKGLRQLTLHSCQKVTTVAISAIAENHSELEYLSLSQWSNCSEEGIEKLKILKNLKKLRVFVERNLTPKEIEALKSLRDANPQLQIKYFHHVKSWCWNNHQYCSKSIPESIVEKNNTK